MCDCHGPWGMPDGYVTATSTDTSTAGTNTNAWTVNIPSECPPDTDTLSDRIEQARAYLRLARMALRGEL